MIALALVAAQISTPPVTLKLPVGTVIKSTLTLEFSDKADDFQMKTVDKFVTTVKDFTDSSIVLEHKITPSALWIDGMERPMGNPEPATVTETRTRFGALKSYEGTIVDPNANLQIARMWCAPLPSRPPQVGSDWSFSDGRDPMPYEFSGVIKMRTENTVVIETTMKGQREDPLRATGEMTLNLSDGWPSRITWKATKSLVPGGEGERVDLVFTWVTDEIAKPNS